MLNQFHDVISGTDILPGTDDALRLYQQVWQTGQAESKACFKALCARIDTAGPGTPIVVFNPLAWERTDAVRCDVGCDADPASIRLTDRQGNRVPAQMIGDRSIGANMSSPSFLWRTPFPRWATSLTGSAFGQPPDTEPVSPKLSAREIENGYFRVEIDPTTGCLQSVFDKEQNREVLAATGKGNLIQVLEDFGDSEGFLKSAAGAAEHNEWTGRRCWDVEAGPRIALVERGPVRTVVEVRKKFGLARFRQRITLYAGIRRVDFDLALDWKGKNKMVKVSFPLAVSNPKAAYEIPYGVILRPSRGEEQAAQKWVDISAGDYGVSLLNDSRYGFDVTPEHDSHERAAQPDGTGLHHGRSGHARSEVRALSASG